MTMSLCHNYIIHIFTKLALITVKKINENITHTFTASLAKKQSTYTGQWTY